MESIHSLFPAKKAKSLQRAFQEALQASGWKLMLRRCFDCCCALKGTPAEEAGIKAGDFIVMIDGKSTDGLLWIVAQIRGPVGTTVKFTIIRDGKPLDIKIVRDIIQVRKRKTGWTKRASLHIALLSVYRQF